MEIIIEKMGMSDVPRVTELERQIFSMPWSAQSFETSLRSKDVLYLTAKADGALAGYCGFFQSFDEADIMNVAVREKFRGQGIAYRMLRELMELGRDRGILRYTLEVRAGNKTAIHLYEKLGFKSVGIRKGFYEKPREDAVIMWTDERTDESGYC